MPPGGWGISSRAHSAFQRSRSSARSIDAGDGAEHQLGRQQAGELERRLPAERHDHARPSAAGRGCSASMTLSTSSWVSGSK